MNLSWQDTVAVIVILSAIVYVVMRLFRIGLWKKTSFCDSCQPGVEEEANEKLIEIDLPKKRQE